jgi:hypothetical protein
LAAARAAGRRQRSRGSCRGAGAVAGAQLSFPPASSAMTIVRLGPDAAPIPWPWKVRLEANEKLIKALQSGLVRSAGLYNCFGQLRFIPATDWKTLRPAISRNMLVPWDPGHRRFDWIVRIVANLEDIRREFTNEPSIVALEPPSEKPKHRGGRPAIYDWEAVWSWKQPGENCVCFQRRAAVPKSRPHGFVCNRRLGHAPKRPPRSARPPQIAMRGLGDRWPQQQRTPRAVKRRGPGMRIAWLLSIPGKITT